MHRMLSLAVVLLPTVASAQHGPRVAQVAFDIFAMPGSESAAAIRKDFTNIRRALGQALAHLRALPARQRSKVQAHARWIVRECPYRHATVRMLQALRLSANHVCRSSLPLGDARLRATAQELRETLDLHVTLLEMLDVTGVAAANGGREALVTSLLDTVRKRVDALSPRTREQLEDKAALVGRHTARTWDSKFFLIEYRSALGRMATLTKACSNEAATTSDNTSSARADRCARIRAELKQMTNVISCYAALYC